MIDNKIVKKQMINYYLGLFLNNTVDYIRKDMRTYANYDDYKDVKYVSRVIQLDADKQIQFQIKKSHLRLYLNVMIANKNMDNGRFIRLYQDLFYIKKKDKIKNKILNIVNNIDYEELLKLTDSNFITKLKLESLKNKI